MKYARIVNGYAIDVVDVADKADIATMFNAQFLDGLGGLAAFVSVPDSTASGAKANGDGTYTNPVIEPTYRTLSPSEFFGVVLKALGPARTMELLNDKLVETGLNIAKTVDRFKGNTVLLLAHMQSLQTNPLTSQELAAIETVWKAL